MNIYIYISLYIIEYMYYIYIYILFLVTILIFLSIHFCKKNNFFTLNVLVTTRNLPGHLTQQRFLLRFCKMFIGNTFFTVTKIPIGKGHVSFLILVAAITPTVHTWKIFTTQLPHGFYSRLQNTTYLLNISFTCPTVNSYI